MKSKNIGYYTFDRKELGTQVVNSDSVNSDSESVEELEYDSDGSDYIPRIDSNDSSTVRQLIYVSMLYQISFLRTFNHFISSKPGFFSQSFMLYKFCYLRSSGIASSLYR
jgi:hypothetical protein